jgi:hypothetical protein
MSGRSGARSARGRRPRPNASQLSLGLFAGEVGLAVGVVESLGDGKAVQSAVELAIAAAVEAVSDRVSG